MTPLASINGGGVLEKMFPHRLTLKYTCSYTAPGASLLDDEEITTVTLDEMPCSVQNAVAVNGEYLPTDYVILSPCLDLSAIDDARVDGGKELYEIDVVINGRTFHASGNEIVDLDNRPTHNVDGIDIGCCIKIKLSDARWLFGE